MPEPAEHLRLEIAHAVHVGHRPGQPPPLEDPQPVPGCGCVVCLALGAGASRQQARELVRVVRHLALVSPYDRDEAVETANQERERLGLDPLPLAPETCARLAAWVTGAVRPRPAAGDGPDRDRPLPVERARRVPILKVADRLGLGEPVGRWGEPRVLCPFHDDHDPSLRLREPEGLWYCDPCGQGGDGIQLVKEALGIEFAPAVRWIAEGGAALSRDPAQGRLLARD